MNIALGVMTRTNLANASLDMAKKLNVVNVNRRQTTAGNVCHIVWKEGSGTTATEEDEITQSGTAQHKLPPMLEGKCGCATVSVQDTPKQTQHE